MLELNIQKFYDEADTYQFSNSVWNSGDPDIAKHTYQNALNYPPLLTNTDQIQKAREYFKERVSEWGDLPDNKIQAILIQWISAEIQEFNSCDNMADYEKQTKDGHVSGSIFESEGDLWIGLY